MKRIFRQSLSALAVAAIVSISSCDSLTHDDISECPEGMVIELVPKYAERLSFQSEVNDVHIFIYNSNDECVRELEVDGTTLAADDYCVTVSLPEGSYRLVAWNGIDDTENYSEESAAVSLKAADNQTENQVTPLWYGSADDITIESLALTHVQVPMIEDTNDFHISLCLTSGEDLDPNDFQFSIVCPNANMAADNSVLDSPDITYLPYKYENQVIEGTVNSEIVYSMSGNQLHLLTAHINTMRLTVEHPAYLLINSKQSGACILKLNLNDYILKAFKGSHNYLLSDQQYFDAEDDFNIVFFLSQKNDDNPVVVESSPIYYCFTVLVNDWILREQSIVLGELEED